MSASYVILTAAVVLSQLCRIQIMSHSPRTLKVIDRALESRSQRARWQAAIALGEFVASDPERVCPLVVKHGSRRHADVRMAIATCVLEHLLELHFNTFFSRIENAARSSFWFAATTGSCWQMGQAELPQNASRWRRLMSGLRPTRCTHEIKRRQK